MEPHEIEMCSTILSVMPVQPDISKTCSEDDAGERRKDTRPIGVILLQKPKRIVSSDDEIRFCFGETDADADANVALPAIGSRSDEGCIDDDDDSVGTTACVIDPKYV